MFEFQNIISYQVILLKANPDLTLKKSLCFTKMIAPIRRKYVKG